ncbi:MAG: hypothetical protein N3I86_09700 [Verrucomicrobiae bacterium]|nr:hypothetical protein [Verrucomicrobiae bacterium]
MARLYREALERNGVDSEIQSGALCKETGNAPLLQLPAPPVPSPQEIDDPEAHELVPLKSGLPRRFATSGRKR